MGIRIRATRNPKDYEKVYPDFIYNRFDKFCKAGEFEAVRIITKETTRIVEYQVTGEDALVGLWLTPITAEEVHHLLYYIHRKHPEVKKVTYRNGYVPYGKKKWTHNHFKIIFPETVEEMESRVSSKSRAKMRKKLLRAEEAYGEMKYLEYTYDKIPDEVVEAFFCFKKATRKRTYDMTPREYLDRYHVSHCTVLMFGSTIGAIRFSCEQCPIVYGENFTFNPELKDYSVGRAVFFHHLLRLVEKKHPALFFAGGDFEYKTHYGSIEEMVHDCYITLSEIDFSQLEEERKPVNRMKAFLKTHLPPKVVNFLRRVKGITPEKISRKTKDFLKTHLPPKVVNFLRRVKGITPEKISRKTKDFLKTHLPPKAVNFLRRVKGITPEKISRKTKDFLKTHLPPKAVDFLRNVKKKFSR